MWQYRQSLTHNDWLMHFGILGQRWGVRRFQNEDGTLTKEGKERYRLTQQAQQYYQQAKENHRENILNDEQNIKDLKQRGPDSAKDWLDYNFGKDWHDKEFMRVEWDVDDPIEFGKKEAKKEYEYQLNNSLSSLKYNKKALKECDKLIDKWKKADINSLSKEELKSLKRIDDWMKTYG